MIKRSAEGAHFVMASNCPRLRHKCRVAKIPYMYIHKNGLILEGVKVEGAQQRTTIQAAEIEKVKQLKEELGVGEAKNVYSHKKKKAKKGANPLSMKKKKGAVGKNSGGEKPAGKSRGARKRRAQKAEKQKE